MNELISTMSEYLSESTDPPIELGPDEDLFTSGALDSLGIANLVAFLEEKTGISISLTDLTIENFGTLNAISAFVMNKKGSP